MTFMEIIKRRWKYIVSIIISIVAVTLILVFGVDFTALGNILNSAKISYLLIAVSLFLLGLGIGAVRVRYLLKINDYKLSFLKTLLYHFYGMLFSAFTPARAGYAMIAHPLRENKIPVSKSLSIFFIGQLFDFALRVPISLIGILLIIIAPYESKYLWLAIIGIVILLTLSAMTYVFSSGRLFGIERLFDKRFPKFGEKIRTYKDQYKELSWKQSTIIASLTLGGWLVFSLKWFLISIAINYQISFLDSAFLLPLIFTISFLPISIAGLGFVEGGVILLYALRYPELSPTLLGSIALTFMIIERSINILSTLPGIFTFYEVSK